MGFFDQHGNQIQGPHWLDMFEPPYFLNGPNIVRNRTSPLVEQQVCALLNQNGLGFNELKTIMGWKLGEIRHRLSQNQGRIVFTNSWGAHATTSRSRYNYTQSIQSLANQMNQIMQHVQAGHPDLVFNLHTQLDYFMPTTILTIVFFVTHGQQLIYDKYAHIAALAINQGQAPGAHIANYHRVQNWGDYEAYKELLVPIVAACGQQAGHMPVPRPVDRALWVYGHLFRI